MGYGEEEIGRLCNLAEGRIASGQHSLEFCFVSRAGVYGSESSLSTSRVSRKERNEQMGNERHQLVPVVKVVCKA